MIRTGIYGGSFNPIHIAHISLAQALLQAASLDEIWLVVSPQNPLKQASQLLADDKRLQLARKALEPYSGLQASDFEFHLPKPSYMWHTLCALRQQYPDREFVLIIGADNWQSFDRWYRADDIVASFPIVVYPRPGYDICAHDLPPTVSLAPTPLLDVSSTDIRERIRHGESIHNLVPEAIESDVIEAYSAQQ